MDPKEINREIKGGLDAFLLDDDPGKYSAPWINTQDDLLANGMLDETGEATPKGELFVELLDRGMFDETGALTEKGRAYMLDERQLRSPDNWRAFKMRVEDGIENPDIPWGETLSATADYLGDAAVGGLERIKQEAQSLWYNSKTWKGFVGMEDNRPDWLKKEMDVTGTGVLEGGIEALAQMGGMADVAQGLMGEQLAKITGEDAAAEENLWKARQRQWSLNKDIEELQAGDILDDVVGLEGTANLMEQRRAELGDEAFAAQYERASAAGNIFADPTNLLVGGVAAKAGRAVPLATRIQLSADRILVRKLATEARLVSLGVEAAAAQRVASKASNAANLATRMADDLAVRAEATGDQVLLQRSRQAAEIAARSTTAATKAGDELARITQQSADLTAASEKLAARLPAAVAERTNQLLTLGRQAKALPATAIGATLEKIGRGLTAIDSGLREVGQKYGVSQAYELLRSGIGQAGLYGSGMITGPVGPAIGAAGTVLRSGGTLERLGQFSRVIGKEAAKARGSVPFWQRVGNYAELSPVHKATARFMSHVEMGGALPGAIRRTGRGVLGAYPVDLAFEYLAQGGEMSPNTLKQAFAESLVLGGSSAAIGGILMGSKARHRQLAIADEMNFRAEMTDPVQRTLYNAIPDATRRSIATYAAIHPNLEFRFTNQGPSSYQDGTVVLNIASTNPIRALAAHEVMHHVTIRHQMEEGIAAMLVGDSESGGLLRAADGTLDTAFQEFVDSYQKRLTDSNLPPASLSTIAVEYYIDQSADRLADMAESGELSQIAGRTDMRRAIDRMIDATLPKLPIIRSLHFNLGGMMDQEGRVVMGNGLLADGMRELPQVKAMTRKMLRAGAGRALGGFEQMGGDGPDGKGGVSLPVAKGDKVMLDKLVALFATEEVNGQTRVKYDKNGDPIMIDAATDAARAQVGKVIGEIYNDLRRPRRPGELYMAENGTWEGTHIGSDVLTELGRRGILNNEQMRILRNINSATKNFTGAVFSILNHPATRKVGKKVRYATLAPTLRQSVPVAVTITKDGNLLIGLMSVTQLEQNIQTRTASRRGKKLYNGDTEAVRADVNAVMEMHRQNQATDGYFREKYGAARGDEYKNFINTVFGLVGGDAQRIRNPLFEADRIDSKTQVYRTYRLDRISQATRMDGVPAMPFSYGAVKMNLFPNGLPTLDEQGRPVVGRNMPEPLTPAHDAAYLDAVEAGDMETAQRMVDEAAKKAGYDLKVYHGKLGEPITEFDSQFIGSNYEESENTGFHFTNSPAAAVMYAGADAVNVGGYVSQDGDEITWWVDREPYGYDINLDSGLMPHLNKGGWGVVQELFLKLENPLEVDARNILLGGADAAEQARNEGHDGVVILNADWESANPGVPVNNQYIVFSPSQIKSADPVTYDEQGNVIPLSQRFNPQSNDIRYMPEAVPGLDTSPDFNNLAEVVDHIDSQARDHLEANGIDISNMTDEQIIDYVAERMTTDASLAVKMKDSGKEWYGGDIRYMDSGMSAMFPYLNTPLKRVLFKGIVALTSFGNTPFSNLGAAIRLFDTSGGNFKNLLTRQPDGSGWTNRAIPVEEGIKRLNKLIADKGETGAAKWLLEKHPVSELKKYNPSITKPKGAPIDYVQYGGMIFGDKGGPFFLNLNGIEQMLTMDLWFSRSWNRYLGTLKLAKPEPKYGKNKEIVGYGYTQDTPRNDSERILMVKAVNRAMERLNSQNPGLDIKVRDLQAILWYYEQRIYTALGSPSESGSYKDATRRILGSAGFDSPASLRAYRKTQKGGANADFRTIAESRKRELAIPKSRQFDWTRGEEHPVYRYWRDNDADGGRFHQGISSTAKDHDLGAAVEVKDLSFYKDPSNKIFLSDDGTAGAAVTKDGDLVSVFKHPSSQVRMHDVLSEAAKQARTLDCFDIDGFLPEYYSHLGFRPVSRLAWDDKFAPPKWNYEKHGRPDIVFMVKTDKVGGIKYDDVRGKIPLFTKINDAVKVQRKKRIRSKPEFPSSRPENPQP